MTTVGVKGLKMIVNYCHRVGYFSHMGQILDEPGVVKVTRVRSCNHFDPLNSSHPWYWVTLYSVRLRRTAINFQIFVFAYATSGLSPSVCRLSVRIVHAKRCILAQKLLLRAYRKSYVRNRSVPKWMTLTFV